jgi:transcriptional regulator with XRE-family HTH domain
MYEIFEKLLTKHGVTPYKVSKATGIATATLSDWKNGKSTPKLDKMQKIADYFGVSVDYLLGKEKTPTQTDGRSVSEEDIKLALFGGDGEVTDEMWEEALFAAQLIKERYKRKKKGE